MEQEPIIDPVTLNFLEILDSHGPEITSKEHDLTQKVRSQTFPYLRIGEIIEGEDGLKKLRAWMTNIEREVETVCKKHSKLYWLLLTRRIPAIAFFPAYKKKLTGFNELITLTLAVLKYGLINEFDIDSKDPNNIHLNKEDILDVFQLSDLCSEYSGKTAAYRILNKEGYCIVQADGQVYCDFLNQSTKILTENFDRRMDKQGGFFSTYGFFDPGYISGLSLESQDWKNKYPFIICAIVSEHSPRFIKIDQKRFPINYRVVFLNLKGFYNYLKMFDEEVKKKFILSPEEIVSWLMAFTQFALIMNSQDKPYHEYQLRTRALAPGHKRWYKSLEPLFRKMMQEVFSKTLNQEHSQKLVKNFYEKIVLRHGKFKKISLLDRRPISMFYDFENFSAVDYIMGYIFLNELFSNFKIRNTLIEIRGKNLEKQVADYIMKEISNKGIHANLIFCSKELWKGGKRIAEIDIAIKIGNTLFLIDTKATTRTREFDRSETVKNRWLKLCDWLSENDERARKLAQNPEGSNYKLKEIKYILPIICSAWVEYVYELDEKYFLTPEIPRVATPPEIIEFLTTFDEEDLTKKSYIVEVTIEPNTPSEKGKWTEKA